MTASARYSVLIIAIAATASAGCRQSQYYRNQGTAIGAVTGALAGAAIGDKNGEGLAGAAIGTVAGALVGSAIGDGIDSDVAQAQAVAEQRLGRKLEGAVTMNDVVSMTQANLSDDVIITQIRANGIARRPQVGELITLREQGVSDMVVKAMQSAKLAAEPEPQVRVIRTPRPVVVREHHYVVPRPSPLRHHHIHHHRPRHSGSHFGFSYHN